MEIAWGIFAIAALLAIPVSFLVACIVAGGGANDY